MALIVATCALVLSALALFLVAAEARARARSEAAALVDDIGAALDRITHAPGRPDADPALMPGLALRTSLPEIEERLARLGTNADLLRRRELRRRLPALRSLQREVRALMSDGPVATPDGSSSPFSAAGRPHRLH